MAQPVCAGSLGIYLSKSITFGASAR